MTMALERSTAGNWLAEQGHRGGLMRQIKSLRTYPLMEVGGGPWRVLETCPAPRHNTARAARGAAGSPRCVCPVAEALHERYREQERINKAARKAGVPLAEARKKRDVLASMKVAAYLNNIVGGQTMPDLRGGNCQNPEGRAVMDRALASSQEQEGLGARAAAKALCVDCPVLQACGAWALAEEKPAGAWGAVYGGMTVQERRAMKGEITKFRKQAAA